MVTDTEKIFSYINTYAESSELLYLEAIIEACNQWLAGEKAPELSPDIGTEDIRKGIQLAVLKGMQQHAQPHHQMTPDSMGMLIGHMASQLMEGKTDVSLLDPTVGTGNLLFTVMNVIEGNVTANAVEIDDLLVRLAAVSAELLSHPVTFHVQDALRPLLIDPVDLTISDLPVGYYPDDDNAVNYKMVPAEGHAYAHHLLIEQSMNHTKPGGYGIFIIPANLFESEQATSLHQYLKYEAKVRAIIQLPTSLFKNLANAKSLLILQNPFTEQGALPDVLLAQVPDMKNKQAMASFLQEFDVWARKEKK